MRSEAAVSTKFGGLFLFLPALAHVEGTRQHTVQAREHTERAEFRSGGQTNRPVGAAVFAKATLSTLIGGDSHPPTRNRGSPLQQHAVGADIAAVGTSDKQANPDKGDTGHHDGKPA